MHQLGDLNLSSYKMWKLECLVTNAKYINSIQVQNEYNYSDSESSTCNCIASSSLFLTTEVRLQLIWTGRYGLVLNSRSFRGDSNQSSYNILNIRMPGNECPICKLCSSSKRVQVRIGGTVRRVSVVVWKDNPDGFTHSIFCLSLEPSPTRNAGTTAPGQLPLCARRCRRWVVRRQNSVWVSAQLREWLWIHGHQLARAAHACPGRYGGVRTHHYKGQ